MTWGMIGGAAVSVIGGSLLGSQGSSGSQSTTKEIDPRIASLLYGADGTSGLLGAAQTRFNSNPSGLNPQMLQGMNRQWNTLNDPNIAAGYQQQRNLGSSLMQAPIAGNPFASQGGYSRSMFGGGQGQNTGPQQPPGGMAGPPNPMGGALTNFQPGATPQPRQPGAQQGSYGFNPSAPVDELTQLYADIGRTGLNGSTGPDQQGMDFWRGSGLHGQDLRTNFLQGALHDTNPGSAARAAGLLSPQAAGPFAMPAAPPPQQAAPQQQPQLQDWRSLFPPGYFDTPAG